MLNLTSRSTKLSSGILRKPKKETGNEICLVKNFITKLHEHFYRIDRLLTNK